MLYTRQRRGIGFFWGCTLLWLDSAEVPASSEAFDASAQGSVEVLASSECLHKLCLLFRCLQSVWLSLLDSVQAVDWKMTATPHIPPFSEIWRTCYKNKKTKNPEKWNEKPWLACEVFDITAPANCWDYFWIYCLGHAGFKGNYPAMNSQSKEPS